MPCLYRFSCAEEDSSAGWTSARRLSSVSWEAAVPDTSVPSWAPEASSVSPAPVLVSAVVSSAVPAEGALSVASGTFITWMLQEEIFRCAIVHPDYRGNGLQRKLLEAALARLRPGIVGIGATVSPENQYSLNNALASGFEIVCRREMYGGDDRDLLAKRL